MFLSLYDEFRPGSLNGMRQVNESPATGFLWVSVAEIGQEIEATEAESRPGIWPLVHHWDFTCSLYWMEPVEQRWHMNKVLPGKIICKSFWSGRLSLHLLGPRDAMCSASSFWLIIEPCPPGWWHCPRLIRCVCSCCISWVLSKILSPFIPSNCFIAYTATGATVNLWPVSFAVVTAARLEGSDCSLHMGILVT